MSGSAPEAVASLLSMARSSDTRLSVIFESSKDDSELALGESGMKSLLDLTRVLPKKKPRLEGLIIRAPPEPALMGGGGDARSPALTTNHASSRTQVLHTPSI